MKRLVSRCRGVLVLVLCATSLAAMRPAVAGRACEPYEPTALSVARGLELGKRRCGLGGLVRSDRVECGL